MSSGISQTKENIFSKWKSPSLTGEKPTDVTAGHDDPNPDRASYDAAHREGYQAGLEQAKAETDQQLQLVTDYLVMLSRPFDEQNQQLAESLAALSGKIAKAVIRKELHENPELIMTIVRDSLAALNDNHGEITLHLHPEDAKLIREMIDNDGQEKIWTLVDDPLISRHECRVVSNDSLVEANIDTCIDLIVNQFIEDSRGEAL